MCVCFADDRNVLYQSRLPSLRAGAKLMASVVTALSKEDVAKVGFNATTVAPFLVGTETESFDEFVDKANLSDKF
jgi:hypothetical protein